MNEYRLSDLCIGSKHSFDKRVTLDMMLSFSQLTGDFNLLHTNLDFATARGYRDRVSYGMLTAAFYSTLVGMYLPGKYALLQGLDVTFLLPVFPEDVLTITGEIVSIHHVLRQIEISSYISNHLTKKVSRAKIKVGVSE
jgi:3-hydroxybutyryl-CoA dehydratase